MRISRSVMAVGGMVVAAGLITLATPKAVHAVAAALVQVTNTASNPVVTQGVGAQAGNMVHLTCSQVSLEGTSSVCTRIGADGSVTSDYTVPAGESLVITAIDVLLNNVSICPGDYNIRLGTPTLDGIFLHLTTTNALVTTHFTYPSGLVIGPGIRPTWTGDLEVVGQGEACSGFESVDLFGYLTAA
jgi:hypothetical protein